MPPGGNRSNKTDSKSYQSNSRKSIHSYFYLRVFLFLFLFKLIVSYIYTHTPALVNMEAIQSFDLGECFKIPFWKSLGLILFWRILCIFAGSPHWSDFLACFQPGRAPDLWAQHSSVCADGHTTNVAPEAGPVTRELTEPEKAFRFNKSAAVRAEVSGALQLGETQVNVRFQGRRVEQSDGERGRSHPRATHTTRTHAPLLELVISLSPPHPAYMNSWSPVCAGSCQTSPWFLLPPTGR